MKYLLIFFLLFITPVAALADPPAGAQTVVHNGVPGIWFPMESARRLLSDVEEIPSLRLQLQLLNEQLHLKQETITLLQHNASILEEQSEEWRRALQETLSRPVLRPTIWQSHEFWFFSGFLSAGLLAIGLSYGMSN